MASIMDMKIEQLAIGVTVKEDWDVHAASAKVTDMVIFDGIFRPTPNHDWKRIIDKIGFLAFNYDQGLELEYLHYPDTQNTFHQLILGHQDQKHYLSHAGVHVDDIDKWCEEDLIDNGPDSIVHQRVMDVVTKDHTNEYLRQIGRKYRYVIFDCRSTHGFFWKLIQRVNVALS